ncbi:MAG: hypothetical protein VX252_16310 [Myxococcota bacterium]|nr:hypothetical protein [Myxococcota bacterium]
MKEMKRWHLLLIPIPIFGWLLLAALLADEFEISTGHDRREKATRPSRQAHPIARIIPMGIDLAIASALWTLFPPAIGWLFGALLLLSRDVGQGMLSPGRWLYGEPESQHRSFTRSFERNLPLLLPFVGPLTELSLTFAGRPRLGDRLSAITPPSSNDLDSSQHDPHPD